MASCHQLGNYFCQFRGVPPSVNSPKISPNGDFMSMCCRTYVFKETEFIAVTAYQNEKVPHLYKITQITNQFTKSLDEIAHKKIKLLPSPVY